MHLYNFAKELNIEAPGDAIQWKNVNRVNRFYNKKKKQCLADVLQILKELCKHSSSQREYITGDEM